MLKLFSRKYNVNFIMKDAGKIISVNSLKKLIINAIKN